MAAAVLSSCFALPAKLQNLSLNTTCSTASSSSPTFRSLSFSSALSHNFFNKGCLSMSIVRRPTGYSIVCEAAPKKKADSADKRARQAEKRRVYNKARKSEIRTRMKKVMEALDDLKKKPDAQAEEVLPIEKLIAEAYSVIDKAVKVGTLHRNTGARRKSRLARRKKDVEIHHGWYTPAPVTAS
ncbi:hypothetical protein JCGZ_15308 [Jatropha curcas]|uniref:Small ribosomal subunit protein bS20c n=1 Tax=Jatropha curcas TaxID=180498 RepID=A0A067LN37_JATCU|nr:30S ribosomal protein S20, chloroplastic [Jatropha curcas]KDP45864.1 hypothetical protein JCGZ_15308 [Jatropha curcas]